MLDLLSFWPKTGAWSNCALWELWFNSTFGLFLWGGLLLLRLVKLYMIEKKIRLHPTSPSSMFGPAA